MSYASLQPIAARRGTATLLLLAVSGVLPFEAAAAPVNWVPNADGFWDVATNWSSSPALPGAADDVTIDVGGATLRTVTHRSGTNSINSLLSQENFTLSGGTLSINAASAINGAFSQSGGELGGAGTLNVSGAATLSGGTMTDGGRTVLLGTTALTGIGLDGGRTLENRGALVWSAGNVNLNPGSDVGAGRIENAAAGLFEATGNGTIFTQNFAPGDDGSDALFSNAGTVRKRVGTGTTSIDVAFSNSGTVEVQTGTLNLSGGGLSSGTFTVAGGATLQFGGGTHSLTNSIFNASLGRVLVSSGTADVVGPLTHGGLLELTGGSFNNDAATSVASYRQSAGGLGGVGTLNVGGAATLSGGTMTDGGRTVLLGTTALTGIGLDGGRTLENRGALVWSSGNVNLNPGSDVGAGRIENAAAGLFEATGNGTIFTQNFAPGDDGSDALFSNAGTVRKRVGTGTTSIDAEFNSSGTVEVQTGTLNLSGGGLSSGTFTVAGGATLQFGGGTHSLTNGIFNASLGRVLVSSGTVDVVGPLTHGGLLELTSGSFNNDAATSVASYRQSAGGLGGAGTLNVGGVATLSGGTMTDGGRTILLGATALTGIGLDGGRTLTNRGALVWSAGNVNLNPGSDVGAGRIENAAAGLFEATGNGTIFTQNFAPGDDGSDALFSNAGTVRKRVGTGTTSIDAAFNSSGTVEVQTGTLNLSGGGLSSGTFTVAGGATLQFGGGTHSLTNGIFNASLGRVLVSSGTVDVVGPLTHGGLLELTSGSFNNDAATSVASYRQSAGGLGGAGTLNVGGVATLSGGTMTDGGRTILLGATALTGIGLDGGRTLENRGALVWSAGNVNLNPGSDVGAGRIENAAAGLFEATGNGTIFTQNFAPGDDGSDALFSNAGTVRKRVGTGTTSIDAAFNSSGTVEIQTGTLNLSGGGLSSGTFTVAGGATLQFGGGTHSLTNSIFNASLGRVLVSSGTVDVVGPLTHGGLLELTGGSFNNDSPTSVASYRQSAGVLGGTGTLNVSGAATLSGGTMTDGGRTVLLGATALTGIGLDGGRTLENRGALVWSSGNVNLNPGSDVGAGRIENAAASLFEATGNGTIFTQNFAPGDDGSDALFSNAGTVRKRVGTGTTSIDVAFSNSGTVEVESGRLLFTADVAEHSGSTLTAGTWRVSGSGALDLNEPGAINIQTNQGEVILDGAAASFARINTLINNQGAFRLLGSRNFAAVGPFTNSGVLQLAGGAFSAPGLANTATGELFGFGSVAPRVQNAGLVRAVGGSLTLSAGINGPGGTMQSDAGGTLVLGATSAGDVLANNGSLALGASDVSVRSDYRNGNFGTGNAFDARANVSGAGNILAAGDVAQVLTGDVSAGNSASPTLSFGNIHVGDVVTRQFQIQNTGSTGPSIRGALQTAVNGGAITDARLSGTGVTATNFGPVATGASTSSFAVSFTGSTAGALTGQTLHIENNFDNVADQDLQFVNSAVYRLAAPSTATPSVVSFGNRRVGDVLSQTLALSNMAINDGFSEALDARFGANLGAATNNGGRVDLLAAGSSSGTALAVGLDTSVAGARTGTASLLLDSNGSGTSGLGISTLSPQTITVSASVFRLAVASAHTPEPVAFGNRHLGDVVSQSIGLTNTAENDGFSERLNASLEGATTGFTAGGSVQLAASGSDTTALTVGLDTSTVGNKSGTAVLRLASDGAGTSGFAALDLAPQTVNLSGAVYRLAAANVIAPVDFGNVHVGDVLQRTLTVQNTAADDGFSERLNARFGMASDARILLSGSPILGLAAGASDSSILTIGVNTAAAGSVSGTARVLLESDGAGTSGLGITALPSQDVGVLAVISEANVFRLANPVVLNAQPIDFGRHRVGDVVAGVGVNVRNDVPADGFSEGLLGAAGSANGGFAVNGSFGLLAAGQTDTGSISVSLSTAAAGHQAGSATLQFISDGTGTSGLRQTMLTSQNVALNGDVYRLAVANDVLDVQFGNVHEGDVVVRALSLSNTAAADGFSEALNATLSGTGQITAGGSVNLLAAGATNAAALTVRLDTSAVGTRSGSAALQLASDGTGSSGFMALARPGQTIDVGGTVYGLAQAEVLPTTLDFGTHRVGDVVTAQDIQVRNMAAADGFHEGLDAVLGLPPTGFQIQGDTALQDLAAGDAAALQLTLDTRTAGVFDDNVIVELSSNGTLSGLANTALGTAQINLVGTVNNLAAPRLAFGAGDGGLSGGDLLYVFDFGSVQDLADTTLSASLVLSNAAIGPADNLDGDFDLASAGSVFGLSGFNAVRGLAAGASLNTLMLVFDTSRFMVGGYSESIFLDPRSVFAGLDDLQLRRIELRINGRILAGGVGVPAPSTWTLLLGAACVLQLRVVAGRRRR